LNDGICEDGIVIIGNGIAGLSAAEAARKNNNKIPITIISDEKYLTYYRLRLCEEIISEEENGKGVILHDYEWYSERNISLILEKKVTAILPEEMSVLLDTGEKLNYSKLIIASGCSSRMPDIKGIEKNGVFGLRSLKDAEGIKEKLKKASRAVVAGGGLLGLEAAYNLRKKGLEVSIVDICPHLLSRQLDEQASLLLEKKVRSLGIELFMGLSVQAINGGNFAEQVLLSDGTDIKSELVLFSAGVLPNLAFIDTCSIQKDRGIIVNERMLTDNLNIYACGDVAEFQKQMPGQWAVSMNQGSVAGLNASGGDSEYIFNSTPYFLNTMGIKLYSIGNISINGDSCDTLEYIDEKNYVYQKLVFDNGLCVGGILMGDVGKFSKYNNAVRNSLRKEDVIAENLVRQA
jgi:nitrite reductase (NADH) large subunit